MTPEEKAKEIAEKFYLSDNPAVPTFTLSFGQCKLLASIVAKEIIHALSEYDDRTEQYLKEEKGIEFTSYELQNMDSSFRYWNQVLKEIDLL